MSFRGHFVSIRVYSWLIPCVLDDLSGQPTYRENLRGSVSNIFSLFSLAVNLGRICIACEIREIRGSLCVPVSSWQENSLDTQPRTMYNIHLTNRGFLIWRTNLQLKRPSRRGQGSLSCLLSPVSCLLPYPPILPSLPALYTCRDSSTNRPLFFAKQSQFP